MSRQDKATTERNAKILRDLVKRPENKVCADCKRNDPRWASWNIGVFVCIRCSGIHRSMGTHISKVKSVDLDIWTPEQMQSIQKWGNLRANLYWEAHLKPGHIPPDHKMESFIRSKYESRRWALEGPPPADPSVLDNERSSANGDVPPLVTNASAPMPAESAPPARTPLAMPTVPRPPSHILLSSSLASAARSSPIAPPVLSSPTIQQSNDSAQPSAPRMPVEDLFSLDFHSPPAAVSASNARKDVKSDILSLFGSASTTAPGVPTQSTSPVSLANHHGVAMWGAQPTLSVGTSPFSLPASASSPPQSNQTSTFGADVWLGQPGIFTSFGESTASASTPQSDAFSNLWGDFK
ncbi:ArfGap-domain-containing protein [Calocera viscosa TUFC12733]|uniref:ArfGap-domain-containing protein n=1 Tax=Calocera viscosa (strain TUFC12733) TaxID=1330018 RepID=A0A167QDZ7_CALVF|nr:ArfGap-domain-containing protein [Calocera viscosa TUFC12733]